MKPGFLLRLLPVLSLLAILSACSDDGPVNVQHRHYFNPAWTPDSKIVGFGVDEALRLSTEPIPATTDQMELVFVETREHRRITLPNVNTRHARYEFEVSNKVLAVLAEGVHFFDLEGNSLWIYDRNDEGFVPKDFQLLPSGNGFIWGDSRNGRTHIAITRYDRNTWAETGEEVLKDTLMTSTVIAITLTSHRSYAVRMSDGQILEFDFSGEQLGSYDSTPFVTDNINHQRLFYISIGGKRSIYALEDAALILLDLDAHSVKRLVTGGIRDFSVHTKGSFMVYETYSADTWFGLSNGYPLVRILPHNIMPRFSPNGKYLAAIGLIDAVVDTLTIIQPEIAS